MLTATVTPSVAVLMAGQSQQFTAAFGTTSLAAPVWSVNNVVGGAAATGTISASGVYTAPSGGTGPSAVGITVTDSSSPNTQTVQSTTAQVSLFHSGDAVTGNVASSTIPIVALYTVAAPQGSSAKVDFGTTTGYGLATSAVAAPAAGGNTTVIVAGMPASTTYHMKATVVLPDGTQVVDTDKTFTTGPIPAEALPNFAITQPGEPLRRTESNC
jgi:hypothetical protein